MRYAKRLSFALLFCTCAPALAQPVAKEYQLRAVLLWRFAQFVDWPANAFANTNSPVVIGVLGENPFGDALRLAVKGETAHGRHIEIKHFETVDEIKTCHILYISQSEAPRVKEITAALSGKSILTVSDIDDFTREHGGMVRFLTEQNRLIFRINLEAARSAGLIIDSRLLRMAEVASTR